METYRDTYTDTLREREMGEKVRERESEEKKHRAKVAGKI